MKKITVFTPTFNRAFCLGNLYESLVNQSNKDFIWLVVDDGSTDTTAALVRSWQNKNEIEIEYIFQANRGMHSAHNIAYQSIKTELCVCIDSDDCMPADAIAKILLLSEEIKGDHLAGIIGLDSYKDGTIIGTKIPNDVQFSSLNNLYSNLKVSGDKKLVLKTAVVKKFPPYPVYQNEKLVPLGTLYLMIDSQYQYYCTNDVFCIVEYLEDGSSKTILKQYRKSPKGFGYSRIVTMKYTTSWKTKFKAAIHLVSSAIFSRNIKVFFQSPNLILSFIAIPFGVVLTLYIVFKTTNK